MRSAANDHDDRYNEQVSEANRLRRLASRRRQLATALSNPGDADILLSDAAAIEAQVARLEAALQRYFRLVEASGTE
jgi:hypothetical protein